MVLLWVPMSKLRTFTWISRMFGYSTATFNKDTVLCLSAWAHGWAAIRTHKSTSLKILAWTV